MIAKTAYSKIEESFNDLVPIIIGPNFWYEKFGFKFNDFDLSAADKIKARKNLLAVDSLNMGIDEGKVYERNVLIYIPSPREQKLFGINFSVNWWKANLKKYDEIIDLDPLFGHHLFKDDFISGGWHLFRKQQCFNGDDPYKQMRNVFSVPDPELRIMDIRRFLIFLFLMNINGTADFLDLYNLCFLTADPKIWIAEKNGDGRFCFSYDSKDTFNPKSGIACCRSLV